MNNLDFKKQLINRSYAIAKKIIKLVDNFPHKQSARVIADQLLRSATSIGANIIEAQAASSRKDFTNFLTHSLKSANETLFWLTLSKDLDSLLQSEISSITLETNELTKILGSSVATLKGKRI